VLVSQLVPELLADVVVLDLVRNLLLNASQEVHLIGGRTEHDGRVLPQHGDALAVGFVSTTHIDVLFSQVLYVRIQVEYFINPYLL
jgi:hypothetical protein